jgi:uncharacterized membrane protein
MSRCLSLVAVGLLITAPAFATGAVEDLGAHRVRGMDEFQRVIETRCTVCHSRERVDVAIKKQQDMEKIEQRMLERGAVLTEQDKQVLGTFWGNPMKQSEMPVK